MWTKINSLWSYLSGTFFSVLTVCSLADRMFIEWTLFSYFPASFWRQLLLLYSVLLVRNLVKVWLLVNKCTLKKKKKTFFSHFCKHLGFIYLWNLMFPKDKSSYSLFDLFCLLFNKQFKFEILCLKPGNYFFSKISPVILFFSISLISLWKQIDMQVTTLGIFYPQ